MDAVDARRVGVVDEGAQHAEPVDRTTSLLTGAEFECFSAAPVAGESVLIGLTEAVPSCAVLLRLEAKTAGVGVRPDNPPWAWEAWTETGWQACEIEKDRNTPIM